MRLRAGFHILNPLVHTLVFSGANHSASQGSQVKVKPL